MWLVGLQPHYENLNFPNMAIENLFIYHDLDKILPSDPLGYSQHQSS